MIEGQKFRVYYGTTTGTISHEIGHRLGLTHPKYEYPEVGLMSLGGKYPTRTEVDFFFDTSNLNVKFQ